MAAIEIRPYRPADRDRLIDIFRSAVRDVAIREHLAGGDRVDEVEHPLGKRRHLDVPTFR